MSICLALILAQVPAIEIESADRRCVARIENEHVSVFTIELQGDRRKLWDAPYRSAIAASKFVLANSGRAVAQIAENFNESHAMLRVQMRGQGAVTMTGAELGIPREVPGGTNLQRLWLDETRAPSIEWTDTWFGPCLALDIPCRGGFHCAVDVERMSLVANSAAPPPPRVEPELQGELPGRSAVPYVQSVSALGVARAGNALDVSIGASHATPGWTFLGFGLETVDGDERKLRLTPRSSAPDGIAAQVLSQFRTTARLFDLRPGRYTLDVSGWSAQHKPLVIDVVPENLLVSLHTSGGFAGIDQRVEILSESVARLDPGRGTAVRFVELSQSRMDRIHELLAALPAASRHGETKGAADLFRHNLGFWSGEQWIAIEIDDPAATQPEKDLIESLRTL